MLNAKQRKALRAMPAKQRKVAEQNMRNQNAKRLTRGNGGGGGRTRINSGSNGKNNVHMRALNPFDPTPGYQLTPMVERTLKAKLICDAAFPVTVPVSGTTNNIIYDHAGTAFGMFSPNAVKLGRVKYAIPSGTNFTEVSVTEKEYSWSNCITDKDYLVRPVNWGLSLKYCGEPRYARGQVAIVFVDSIEYSWLNEITDYARRIEKTFSHPRAVIIDVPALARAQCGFTVPIMDEISFRSWKRVAAEPAVVETRDVGQDATDSPAAPETIEQATVEQKYTMGFRCVLIAARGVMESSYYHSQGPDHWPSLRLRCTMDVEYRRGTDDDAADADDTMFRNYATTNPSMAPTATHSFMERAGQLVETVRDALSHPIAGAIMKQFGSMPFDIPLPI